MTESISMQPYVYIPGVVRITRGREFVVIVISLTRIYYAHREQTTDRHRRRHGKWLLSISFPENPYKCSWKRASWWAPCRSRSTPSHPFLKIGDFFVLYHSQRRWNQLVLLLLLFVVVKLLLLSVMMVVAVVIGCWWLARVDGALNRWQLELVDLTPPGDRVLDGSCSRSRRSDHVHRIQREVHCPLTRNVAQQAGERHTEITILPSVNEWVDGRLAKVQDHDDLYVG